MKKVSIAAWNMGLVFRKGSYTRLIGEGAYWMWPSEEVKIYNMANPFASPVSLNILLQDEAFVAATMVIEVKDNEIALSYVNGLFAAVLTPGRYVYWKGLNDYTFTIIDLNKITVDESIDKAVLLRREVLTYLRVYNVESYEKGVLYINGKVEQVLEPGMYYYWKNSVSINVQKADMRAIQLEISGQELLTRDKAALRISFFVQYMVTDVIRALVNNKDYDKQLYILMQLALREYVGGCTLDELMEKKENISGYVVESTRERYVALGVQVSSAGIRDIILPGDMKEIINQVLIAEKKAQANTIMRREETASTRSLLNTAKLMEDNTMLMKLKEMEYVEKIAERVNSISLSGGNQILEQLKGMFVPAK